MLLRDVRSFSSNSFWNVLEVVKQNAVGAEFAGSTRKISRTPRFTLRPLRSAFEFVCVVTLWVRGWCARGRLVFH